MEDNYKNTLMIEKCIKEHMQVEDPDQQELLMKIISFNFLG